ncbi:MAG: cytochrome c oxidase assembly factor Coa1 family protein [Elusimicrobiales bacterium]
MINIGKNIRRLGIALIFGAILLLIVYLVSINSQSYKVATNYIAANPYIVDAVGPIKSSHLTISAHTGVVESSTGGRAEFTIRVTGTLKTGLVHVSLEKSVGGWKVMSATLKLDTGEVPLLVNSR